VIPLSFSALAWHVGQRSCVTFIKSPKHWGLGERRPSRDACTTQSRPPQFKAENRDQTAHAKPGVRFLSPRESAVSSQGFHIFSTQGGLSWHYTYNAHANAGSRRLAHAAWKSRKKSAEFSQTGLDKNAKVTPTHGVGHPLTTESITLTMLNTSRPAAAV